MSGYSENWTITVYKGTAWEDLECLTRKFRFFLLSQSFQGGNFVCLQPILNLFEFPEHSLDGQEEDGIEEDPGLNNKDVWKIIHIHLQRSWL